MRAAPLIAFSLLCLVSATARAQGSADPIPKTVEKALIALAKRADPFASLGPARAAIAVCELELGELMKGVPPGSASVKVISDYFFKTQRYESSTDLAAPSNFYIDQVMSKHQGYCLSLSALILAVAQRLELPIKGVAAPRHFFLRYEGGGERLNIETTEGGRIRSDAFYRRQGVTKRAEKEGVYLQNLSDDEVVAHLLNNEGFIHWQAGRGEVAAERWRQALQRHPKLAEANLNLGIYCASRGKSKESKRLFDRVLAWMPDDVPTILNRAVAAILAGKPAKALEGLDEAQRVGGARAEIAPIRSMILGTLFQPENWKRHQRAIDAEARDARKGGHLARGLSGRYFGGRNLDTQLARRIDREIDFEWRWNSPHPRVPSDNFSIRWDGYVDLPSDGFYSFALVFNDGVRLWVDGVCIIDDWKRNEGGLAQETLEFTKGFHRLRLEYFEVSRFAGVTLKVKRSDQERPLSSRSFWHRKP